MKTIKGLKCPETWEEITTQHYVDRLADMKLKWVKSDDDSMMLQEIDDYWEYMRCLADSDDLPDLTFGEMKEFMVTTKFIHEEIPNRMDLITQKKGWFGRKEKVKFRELNKVSFDDFMMLDAALRNGDNPIMRMIDILAIYTKLPKEEIAQMPITRTYALFFSLLDNTKEFLSLTQSYLERQLRVQAMTEKVLTRIGLRRSRPTSSSS